MISESMRVELYPVHSVYIHLDRFYNMELSDREYYQVIFIVIIIIVIFNLIGWLKFFVLEDSCVELCR